MTNQQHICNSGTAGSSWWAGILGVLELILGFVALALPWMVGTGFIWVLGIILMALALIRLVHAVMVPHSRMWSLVATVLYGLLGWFMFRDPDVSLSITTLIIGWGLIIAAIFQGVIWVQTRLQAAAGWRLFSVLITLILGLMVVIGWPESTAWFVGTLIAVQLIFSGWTLLAYAIGGNLTTIRHH